MKTKPFLLIATLLLFIGCPNCFSQNKGYMTSYRNAEGKALIITEKYLYLVDGQGKEEIYGCDVSADDPNTLWVYQLDGGYDHATVTLKADGSLVYDAYSSSSVFKKDASLFPKLSARVKAIKEKADNEYDHARINFSAFLEVNKWLEGCWICKESGFMYIVTKDGVVSYASGSQDYASHYHTWVPAHHVEDGKVYIVPIYRFDDSSSQTEDGLVLDIKTRKMSSYLYEGVFTKLMN